jgi:hypothetical protein
MSQPRMAVTGSSRLVRAFAPLHRGALGVAGGVVLGSLVFAITLISMSHGFHTSANPALLGQFLIGYTVSLPGALIGLAWGFGAGFVLGWSTALLRNLAVWAYLISLRSRAEMDQYSDLLDHL